MGDISDLEGLPADFAAIVMDYTYVYCALSVRKCLAPAPCATAYVADDDVFVSVFIFFKNCNK